MAVRDFYNILGVDRKASPDDIKRAYRNLARQWHPDHNRSADAEARFKDITEAYKTLSDPELRARYDRLGPALYTADGRPPRPEEFQEAMGAMFSGLFKRRGKAKGEDLRYTISLSLEEVGTGIEKEISVPRQIRCNTCKGDGADPDGGRQTCKVCGGSGRATGPRLFRSECYHCDGAGFTITKACKTCEGEGRVHVDDKLKVKVPPGVGTGQKLKLGGKGNAPRGKGTAGDLFVIVNVADHEVFRRRGDDVLVDLPLTFVELTLGAEVTVPTLDGVTTIKIPAGSAPGKILRLAGRGLPNVGRKSRGDLHLQLVLEVPEGLDASQRDALLEWASNLPDSAHPRRAKFTATMESRR